MSNFLSELKIFGNTELKNDIKYYHVWDYLFDKCALFVTNDDKVYGINIPPFVMTPSYKCVYNEYKNNGNSEKEKPIEIKELSHKKIKEFHIGWSFVLASNEENKLYSWGNNYCGQLGRHTDNEEDLNPTEVIYLTDSILKIKQICVHLWTLMVLLDNGKVIVWGFNGNGGKSRFGDNIYSLLGGDWEIIRKPLELDSLSDIEFIHLNSLGCFAIDKNYTVFSWGHNKYGQLGHKQSSFISQPKESGILSKLKIISIKTDDYFNYLTYFLSSEGKLYILGKNWENIKTVSIFGLFNYGYLTQLELINNDIVVLSNKQKVYEVKGDKIIKTKYKSIEEYSVKKYKYTFKTFGIFTNRNIEVNSSQLIGHGGFGKVYKVYYKTQYYAIKKILINEETKTDEINELQIMKQLKSEFVVKLYDFWTKIEDNFTFLYIQMELCDQTLYDIIEKKNPSIPSIIDYMIRTEIFGQLLFALNYLHSMTPKVIHRDIKPSNILIKYHNDHAQCKLCDFGCSKILEKESSNSSCVGTSRYRALEIYYNKYNEKIDIFSLGISIKELFDNLIIVKTNEFDISRHLKNLKSVITTMIHGEPEERPSAKDIINKMNEFSIDLKNRIELYTLIEKVRNENDYLPLRFLNVDTKTNST